MKRWIDFNLNHPRLVLLILFIITVLSALGFRNLYFDSSTEAMMPKHSTEYIAGLKAKKIFGDSKAFFLTAIQPSDGAELFSRETFEQLSLLVEEIEEFQRFNRNREDRRIGTLMNISGISVKNPDAGQAPEKPLKKTGPSSTEAGLDDLLEKNSDSASKETVSSLEDELDKNLLNGKSPAGKKDISINENGPGKDIWEGCCPTQEEIYVRPVRKKNSYDYTGYRPISISETRQALDTVARRHLDTILILADLNEKQPEEKLSRREFGKIMELWEKFYLYKSMKIVKSFINPVTGKDIMGTAGEIRPFRFIEEDRNGRPLIPSTEEEFSRYRKKLLSNPAYESALYSLDEKGNIRALAFSSNFRPHRNHGEIFEFLDTAIEKYNRSPLKLTTVGILTLQKIVSGIMKNDLKKFMPLILLIVILTFYLNFRLVRGVILPSLAVLIGAAWTIGLMGHFSIPITMTVNMLPPLLVAVGSSYSIHIFNQYLLDQKNMHSIDKKEGLSLAMNHISLTVLLAAITTFAGFISLMVNDVESIQNFGVFAALGTVISVAVSVMLIPSALMLMKLLPHKTKHQDVDHFEYSSPSVGRIIRLLNHLCRFHPGAVFICCILIILVFSYGITKIRIETAPLHNFKKSSFLYKADFLLGNLFRGSIASNFIIDSGRKNGVKDPVFLRRVEEIRAWITSPENQERSHMFHTSSFGDVIKRMNKAMNNENPDFYTIPENAGTINDYMELFSGEDSDSDGRIDSIEPFVDPEFRYVNVIIRTGSRNGEMFTTDHIQKSKDSITGYMNSRPWPEKYTWHLTGEAVNFLVLAKLMVKGQIKSVCLTLAAVALIIFLLFRNWQAAIISLLPISTSIIMTYGLMGLLDINLDSSKALVSAVSIGIGVDDTIHMLKTLKHNLKKGLSIQQAIDATHREAGLAIVYTSLALILGFSVLLLSDFVPVQYLGGLIGITMISTTVSALVLLPSLLLFFNIQLQKELNWRIFRWINLGRIFDMDIDNNR